MGFEKTNFNIEDPAKDVSLIQCIKEHQQSFTERTKRILYLIIGNTVLHLHDTSWLQPDWGSAHIKFFRAASSEIPLRPFIEARLDYRTAGLDDERDDRDAFYHPCPVLVSLAVVLLELYFVKPFNELAKEQNVDLIEGPMGRIAVIDLDQVYSGVEEGGGCESQIPEDYRGLRVAVENCISDKLLADDEGNAVDRQTLRSRIYQNVVKPLEAHLSHGFSQIPLESIDEHAKTIDLAHRGKFITCRESDGRPGTLPSDFSTPGQAQSPTPSPGPAIQQGAHLIEREFCSQLARSVAEVTLDPSSKRNSDVGERTADFFDDEIGDKKKAAMYDTWKDTYDEVYQKYIEKHLSSHPSNTPIRIAVLDTGIEVDHPSIQAHNELKGVHNCYDESRKDLPDTHGHGTFVTNVILDYAPDAHLYVIKITGKNNISLDARIVKNAIDHAVDVWHVDIISMSFGWPSSEFDGYDDLQDAIDRAYSKQILMFAAASNSGGNLGRAYPASSSHVICVHSTDTLGNRSAFSPTEERDRVNIATVGESIRSAWPSSLCKPANDRDGLVYRSGTSYATPILAGIAAFLLQYARLHLSEKEVMKMKRKENMEALLRRCAERGPNYCTRNGYYYVELSLHKHNMFGQDLEFINMCILQALKK
ncbi:hypothetical protein SLS63_011322 [Diaporthe eres]|uniref:Peptidase S8/S53 domain-containing protein n=1 Tax=Diaporthe eres TaxID=83184 RepID=A0ABR1NUG8_DIAER